METYKFPKCCSNYDGNVRPNRYSKGEIPERQQIFLSLKSFRCEIANRLSSYNQESIEARYEIRYPALNCCVSLRSLYNFVYSRS